MDAHGNLRPFAPRAEGIPIVGQAFTLKGGHSTTLIQCTCDAHEPVILIGPLPNRCPACRQGFVCVGFTADATGQLSVQIGLVAPERPAGGSA